MSAVRRLAWRLATGIGAQGGQGLAEYGLIISIIAIASILILTFIGTQVSGSLSEVGSSVGTAMP